MSVLRGERKLNSASAPSVKARRRFWKVLARQPSAPHADPTSPDRLQNVAEQGGTGRENQAHRRVAVIHAVPKCPPSRTELAQRVTRRTVVQKNGTTMQTLHLSALVPFTSASRCQVFCARQSWPAAPGHSLPRGPRCPPTYRKQCALLVVAM